MDDDKPTKEFIQIVVESFDSKQESSLYDLKEYTSSSSTQFDKTIECLIYLVRTYESIIKLQSSSLSSPLESNKDVVLSETFKLLQIEHLPEDMVDKIINIVCNLVKLFPKDDWNILINDVSFDGMTLFIAERLLKLLERSEVIRHAYCHSECDHTDNDDALKGLLSRYFSVDCTIDIQTRALNLLDQMIVNYDDLEYCRTVYSVYKATDQCNPSTTILLQRLFDRLPSTPPQELIDFIEYQIYKEIPSNLIIKYSCGFMKSLETSLLEQMGQDNIENTIYLVRSFTSIGGSMGVEYFAKNYLSRLINKIRGDQTSRVMFGLHSVTLGILQIIIELPTLITRYPIYIPFFMKYAVHALSTQSLYTHSKTIIRLFNTIPVSSLMCPYLESVLLPILRLLPMMIGHSDDLPFKLLSISILKYGILHHQTQLLFANLVKMSFAFLKSPYPPPNTLSHLEMMVREMTGFILDIDLIKEMINNCFEIDRRLCEQLSRTKEIIFAHKSDINQSILEHIASSSNYNQHQQQQQKSLIELIVETTKQTLLQQIQQQQMTISQNGPIQPMTIRYLGRKCKMLCDYDPDTKRDMISFRTLMVTIESLYHFYTDFLFLPCFFSLCFYILYYFIQNTFFSSSLIKDSRRSTNADVDYGYYDNLAKKRKQLQQKEKDTPPILSSISSSFTPNHSTSTTTTKTTIHDGFTNIFKNNDNDKKKRNKRRIVDSTDSEEEENEQESESYLESPEYSSLTFKRQSSSQSQKPSQSLSTVSTSSSSLSSSFTTSLNHSTITTSASSSSSSSSNNNNNNNVNNHILNWYQAKKKYDISYDQVSVPDKPTPNMVVDKSNTSTESNNTTFTTASSLDELSFTPLSCLPTTSPSPYPSSSPLSSSSSSQSTTTSFISRPSSPYSTTTATGGNIKKNDRMTVELNEDLIYLFWNRSLYNTMRGIETGGLLCGIQVDQECGETAISAGLEDLPSKNKKKKYIVTELIFPTQTGKEDSFECTDDEKVLSYQLANNLITLGWIHTHPTQTVFLSSVDIHNQHAYQQQLPESIAIVVSPKPTPNYEIFSLNSPKGMRLISSCTGKGFHPHDQWSDDTIYSISNHVIVTNPINNQINQINQNNNNNNSKSLNNNSRPHPITIKDFRDPDSFQYSTPTFNNNNNNQQQSSFNDVAKILFTRR
ncbi:hypothetical protein DFA_09320 [Cavenderia fasciculata]|uniref:MPN domain-containing protein n=1 Tax=Cavenderia fasciculata TaxID=261658 RepID=F4Q7A8_CACFS|nr:uncharacterized protein DFA_09320 [Cavenderia fasciculata]EGG16290.1 hypothetical protein DFA_09320 [Cavenderia fasciculata]|eukprot:XP_004354674.1 hypothetical protein DFA_09320 [Cavenderia fasciculata]